MADKYKFSFSNDSQEIIPDVNTSDSKKLDLREANDYTNEPLDYSENFKHLAETISKNDDNSNDGYLYKKSKTNTIGNKHSMKETTKKIVKKSIRESDISNEDTDEVVIIAKKMRRDLISNHKISTMYVDKIQNAVLEYYQLLTDAYSLNGSSGNKVVNRLKPMMTKIKDVVENALEKKRK